MQDRDGRDTLEQRALASISSNYSTEFLLLRAVQSIEQLLIYQTPKENVLTNATGKNVLPQILQGNNSPTWILPFSKTEKNLVNKF